MRKKEKDISEDGSFSAPVPSHGPNQAASKLIAPADIQQKEFGVARFGGYKMRDVDEFLDQVTDSMSAVVRENEQLRNGGAAPVVGTSDLADVNRQADEIIQRARDEAAAIIAAARQAAPEASPAAGRSAEDRAAIGAFLTREKAFLQSLAGLVQGHAEDVKSMARVPRPAADPQPPAPTKTPVPAPVATAKPAPPAPKPESKPAPPAAGTHEPSPAPEATVAIPTSQAPPQDKDEDRPEERVSVVEPQPVAARRPDTASDEPIEGEGSLRELFWGED
jgi:DivIVA domain-containing protein